jgi:hypothetical protein
VCNERFIARCIAVVNASRLIIFFYSGDHMTQCVSKICIFDRQSWRDTCSYTAL